MQSRPGVLAVMDGYRLTGPARQLLAAAVTDRSSNARITLVLFHRSTDPTPLITAAKRLEIPTFAVRDRFPWDPRTVLVLAGLLTRSGADILQTHGYKSNVLARLLASRLRRPWVAFLHGETWENRKVRVYFALERLAVRRADRIVVVSHHMARMVEAQGIPAAKIRVIHNACLVEPAAFNQDMPACRPDTSPVVGVVGRLSPEKGVDIALRVQQLVARRRPEARLWVMGEGPDHAKLKERAERLGIASSVDWLGYREDIDRLYLQLAVLLIPSRSEGLPNVALEAMAYGVPVVATAVGGIPELVSDGRTGFLSPAEDVERMADRVVRLLDDASLRRRLGQAARAEVTSRFSPCARFQALAEIYAEVIAERPGARREVVVGPASV